MCKILFLSTVHSYNDVRIFHKELFSLKKKYSDILFLVPVDIEKSFVEKGVQIVPLSKPKSKKERIKLQIIVWSKVKEIKPDIVHFHDPELIFLGYLIKKILKIKVIFDIHENVSASFKDNLWLPKFLKPILPSIYKIFEKFLIKDFDALIIAEQSYNKIYGDKAIEILNYPMLDNKYKTKDFSGKINFVYVGGIWVRRGLFKMLLLINRLYKENFDIQFFLVGPFVPPALLDETKEFISKNNLTEIIKIYGRINLEEVYKVLNKSHIGFSLMQDIGNYKGSLSTKIFEYMTFGIPYIVSDFTIYNKYTFEENTGIMVNYENDDEIYRNVRDLLLDKERMLNLGKNGRRAVETKWNWNSQEKKLFSIYDSILIKQI